MRCGRRYSSLQLSFFISKTEGVGCEAVWGLWRDLPFHIPFERPSLPGTIRYLSSGDKGKSKQEVRKRHEIWDEQRAVGEETHKEKGFTWMRSERAGNAGIWDGVGVIEIRSCYNFSSIFLPDKSVASAESKHGVCMGDNKSIDKYEQGFQLQGDKQKTRLVVGDKGGRKEKSGKAPAGGNNGNNSLETIGEAFSALTGHFLHQVFAEPFSRSPPLLSQGL